MNRRELLFVVGSSGIAPSAIAVLGSYPPAPIRFFDSRFHLRPAHDAVDVNKPYLEVWTSLLLERAGRADALVEGSTSYADFLVARSNLAELRRPIVITGRVSSLSAGGARRVSLVQWASSDGGASNR